MSWFIISIVLADTKICFCFILLIVYFSKVAALQISTKAIKLKTDLKTLGALENTMKGFYSKVTKVSKIFLLIEVKHE